MMVRDIFSIYIETNFLGSQSYTDQINYIEQKYRKLKQDKMKQIYCHHTCATDTNQIQVVLDSVIDMIIRTGLTNNGML